MFVIIQLKSLVYQTSDIIRILTASCKKHSSYIKEKSNIGVVTIKLNIMSKFLIDYTFKLLQEI